jgi:hypothetical protein
MLRKHSQLGSPWCVTRLKNSMVASQYTPIDDQSVGGNRAINVSAFRCQNGFTVFFSISDAYGTTRSVAGPMKCLERMPKACRRVEHRDGPDSARRDRNRVPVDRPNTALAPLLAWVFHKGVLKSMPNDESLGHGMWPIIATSVARVPRLRSTPHAQHH